MVQAIVRWLSNVEAIKIFQSCQKNSELKSEITEFLVMYLLLLWTKVCQSLNNFFGLSIACGFCIAIYIVKQGAKMLINC